MKSKKPPESRKQIASVRSIRCPDDTWAAAKRRADYEQVTMSHVLSTFVAGYANNLVNLPKVTLDFDN